MADVVELVPKGAMEKLEGKTVRAGRTLGARRLRVAGQRQPEALQQEMETSVAEQLSQARASIPEDEVSREPEVCTPHQPGRDAPGPSAGETPALPGRTPQLPETSLPRAEDCLEMFEIEQAGVVVVWRLERIEEWGAPMIGAACKEILGKKWIRRVVFDFSGVEEMSTAAVSTLVRFKNTIVHLDKAMYLVAGPRLRGQLASSYVDRMIEVVDSVARVVGSEICFEERRVVRKGKRRWWPFFLIVVVLASSAAGQGKGAGGTPALPGKFPELRELEASVADAPDLQALRLEIEKLKLGQTWTKGVSLHTSYSQHFASYVPVLSPGDRKVSGDTFVLGASISVSLDDLLHRKKNQDLELRLKQLEYERVYQSRLAALRVLYGNFAKLREELQAIEARAKTAGLKLERVKAGLQFEFLNFDPIDLAEAEEAMARWTVERRQTEIEIENLEIRMLQMAGRTAGTP